MQAGVIKNSLIETLNLKKVLLNFRALQNSAYINFSRDCIRNILRYSNKDDNFFTTLYAYFFNLLKYITKLLLHECIVNVWVPNTYSVKKAAFFLVCGQRFTKNNYILRSTNIPKLQINALIWLRSLLSETFYDFLANLLLYWVLPLNITKLLHVYK